MPQNGGDDDPILNCVLEVCCGGEHSQQTRALAIMIRDALPALSNVEADAVAKWITAQFDLAPKGTLYGFKQAIAKLARGPGYTV